MAAGRQADAPPLFLSKDCSLVVGNYYKSFTLLIHHAQDYSRRMHIILVKLPIENKIPHDL